MDDLTNIMTKLDRLVTELSYYCQASGESVQAEDISMISAILLKIYGILVYLENYRCQLEMSCNFATMKDRLESLIRKGYTKEERQLFLKMEWPKEARLIDSLLSRDNYFTSLLLRIEAILKLNADLLSIESKLGGMT